MKLGFIGFGKMAQAISQGVIEKGLVDESNILVSDKNKATLSSIAEDLNIQATTNNQQVYDSVDTLILAVKPQHLADVLDSIDTQRAKPLVISIAAGIKQEFYNKYLPTDSFIRTMPNLNAQVGEAMTAIVRNSEVPGNNLDQAVQIFDSVGKSVVIEEGDIDTFTAIAGSSPALAFMFIDLLARAAVRHGMYKETATKIASQAVLGSAKTMLESEKNPWELIDNVSSPGGTTSDGVLSLLEDNFSGSIIRSVDSMIEKSQKMGE